MTFTNFISTLIKQLKMRNILSSILISATVIVNAQNNQVQNASNYLASQEYDKAKASADAASVHDATKSSAKLWMYRGKIYQDIYSSKKEEVNKLDNQAQEKAVESYITCLQLDKNNIYKDDVKGLLVVSSAALNNKAQNYIDMKDYDKAIQCLDLLEKALPYDFDQGLKRNNITKSVKIIKNGPILLRGSARAPPAVV